MIIDSIHFLGLPGVGQAIFIAILIDRSKQSFSNSIFIAILVDKNGQMLPTLTDAVGNSSIQYLQKGRAIYYQVLTPGGEPRRAEES